MAKAGHGYPQVDPRAEGLMDRRVAAVGRGSTVRAALAAAARTGAHVVVLGPREAVRQTELHRAVRWGLGGLRAADIAWRELPVLAPAAPEVDVRRRVMAGASLVLIREAGRLVGVVDGRAPVWVRPALSVAHRLEQPGDPAREIALWLLRLAGKLGEAMGVTVWAAGGFVRDLLRDSAPLDVDLVVEGDGPAFARRLADEVRGTVTVHGGFGTASVTDGRSVDGAPLPRVDVATARRERYAAPGALPVVEPASLGEDLFRRDFTVNAMAIALAPAAFGRLADAAGGQRDLDRRRLELLHPLSFVEDPTRVFRAARYAARLGFALGPEARRGLRLALGRRGYPALSGARLLGELRLVLREPVSWRALELLRRWGAYRLWDPGFRPTPRGGERLRAARRFVRWLFAEPNAEPVPGGATLEIALLALLVDQPAGVGRRALARLGLVGSQGRRLAEALTRGPRLAARLGQPGLRPSQVAAAAREAAPETTLAAWLVGRPAARRRLQWFLRAGRHVNPRLGAEALVAAGIPRGPAVGAVLRALRDLRLDGRAESPADEERFVQRESARYRKGESR
jgi:tRNA nucleotidyltransferase (CCA-adding enzyme)